jgi:hypothetical protein
VVRIRAPSIRFPNVLFVDARQSLHGRTPHDPARHPRSLSAGDLHLGGCARLSKDAGSLKFHKRSQLLLLTRCPLRWLTLILESPIKAVPDGGTPVMLLGSALGALGMARRFLKA